MTAWTTISNAAVALDAPITSPLAIAWRDNPIAIAEGDPSIPANLRATVLLGTLPTTSGTVVTLASLTLANFNRLRFVFSAVKFASGSANYLTFTGGGRVNSASLGSAVGFHGVADVDLASGVFASVAGVSTTTAAEAYSAATTLSTATTSISFTSGAGIAFIAGSITVYGVK